MLRSAKPYMTLSSLIMIYCSLFHSVLSYGIIFWEHSSNTQELFILQKRAVRLLTGHGSRTSCRNIFKQLKILLLKSQYIFSTLLFVSKNRNLFTTNFTIYSLDMEATNHLSHSSANCEESRLQQFVHKHYMIIQAALPVKDENVFKTNLTQYQKSTTPTSSFSCGL
jgi:hypothetical protein